MNQVELIESGLSEWIRQVENRRNEIALDSSLIDQEMVICIDAGELSRSDLLNIEFFLDELDDENVGFVVEEYCGDYLDQFGIVSRVHLVKEIVRDNLVDVYEYRDGVLRIAIAYCFRYNRFESGCDYFDITKEKYEEILDNLVGIPEDEAVDHASGLNG